MSRFIDADKLKNHYAWWNDENKEIFDSIIDAQPTADVKEANANSNMKLYNAADKLLDIVSAALERIAEEEPERFITVVKGSG